MRLIDADSLNVRLSTLDRLAKSDKQAALLGRVLYVLSTQPTVKAETEETKPIDDGDDTWICENCGETVGWEELDKYTFCPECGRKIKWGQK